jgi:hypothetical protein
MFSLKLMSSAFCSSNHTSKAPSVSSYNVYSLNLHIILTNNVLKVMTGCSEASLHQIELVSIQMLQSKVAYNE